MHEVVDMRCYVERQKSNGEYKINHMYYVLVSINIYAKL